MPGEVTIHTCTHVHMYVGGPHVEGVGAAVLTGSCLVRPWGLATEQEPPFPERPAGRGCQDHVCRTTLARHPQQADTLNGNLHPSRCPDPGRGQHPSATHT